MKTKTINYKSKIDRLSDLKTVLADTSQYRHLDNVSDVVSSMLNSLISFAVDLDDSIDE